MTSQHLDRSNPHPVWTTLSVSFIAQKSILWCCLHRFHCHHHDAPTRLLSSLYPSSQPQAYYVTFDMPQKTWHVALWQRGVTCTCTCGQTLEGTMQCGVSPNAHKQRHLKHAPIKIYLPIYSLHDRPEQAERQTILPYLVGWYWYALCVSTNTPSGLCCAWEKVSTLQKNLSTLSQLTRTCIYCYIGLYDFCHTCQCCTRVMNVVIVMVHIHLFIVCCSIKTFLNYD